MFLFHLSALDEKEQKQQAFLQWKSSKISFSSFEYSLKLEIPYMHLCTQHVSP